VREHAFNAQGMTIAFTDEQGQRSTYKYDANNRLPESRDVLGRLTRHAYDDKGNHISTIAFVGVRWAVRGRRTGLAGALIRAPIFSILLVVCTRRRFLPAA
jgi:YD repeat-containing protein